MFRPIMCVFVSVVAVVQFASLSQAKCWNTECQPDSWTMKGCEQYNKTETKRQHCTDGFIYTCCSRKNKNGKRKISKIKDYYGDITYYQLGLTACGNIWTNKDMVAALSFDHFTTKNPNKDPMCKKMAKIVDPTSGRQVRVRIQDKCEACKTNDIDVSPAAFMKLRPLAVGRFKVRWSFV